MHDMLRVFGEDYDTRDGTGERDYIYVTGLATVATCVSCAASARASTTRVTGGCSVAGWNPARAPKRHCGANCVKSSTLRSRLPLNFTEFTLDFDFIGLTRLYHCFYVAPLAASRVPSLQLGEGDALQAFEARDLLHHHRVVPCDAFAIWLHATQRPPEGA